MEPSTHIPADADLPAVGVAAACELFQPAIQTVFGTGNPAPKVLLVGEQPGVGPTPPRHRAKGAKI